MKWWTRRAAGAGLLAAALALMVFALAGEPLQAASGQGVENPHGSFKAECALCHSSADWRVLKLSARFDHARYGFPLEAAHASAACTSCHQSLDFTRAQTACASCHTDPHRGEMGTDCARCHGARSFSDRAPMLRAHELTRFPLKGAHAVAACEGCHRPASQGQMQFVGTSSDCRSCHEADYRATRHPDHAAQGFPMDCRGCHSSQGWDRASFDHGRTRFPLTGAHVTQECASCHTAGGNFAAADPACQSCHQSQYASATPDHAAAGFPASQCATCHNTSTFDGGAFDHGATRFALGGAHAATACLSCHADGVYHDKPRECASCHTDAWSSAVPNHAAAGFAAARCASCHTTVVWSGGRFDHAATAFALSGAHQAVTCNSCHSDNVFDGRSTACIACHQSDYDGASPSHAASGFAPAQCTTCHNTTTFSGATFDHTAATSFPLTGAHRAVTCGSCHGDNVYDGKSTACESCHMADFNSATPNHAASGFPPSACRSCHNTSTFSGATFNHDTNTSFTLTGAHRTVTCGSCHSDNVYDGKPTACLACHASDYSGAAPNHAAAGFSGAQCATCHTTTTWTGATYNHSVTSFPLTGSHVGENCNSCHSDNVFNGKSTECVSCHLANYNGASPDHRAAGFSTTCTRCHNTTTFSGATFDHNVNTGFPLTGAHVGAACANCHSDGVYSGRSTACMSCHMSDYDGAVPNHASTGFAAAACASCHTTSGWAGATFDHDVSTSFALTGAHRTVTCGSCHGDGVYDGKPTACFSCHSSDYSGATLNHTAAGFASGTCGTCHNTTAWAGATYNHAATSFPLTGAHVSASCNSCHSDNVFNNHATDCASCHMADYNAAQPPHASSGFAASACATCHNTTTFAGAVFNHSTTTFPLTGAHQAVSCNSCHSDGVYDGKSTACYSCHASDYAAAVPTHTATSFPTSACASCHTTTAWAGATFNHATTSFPLTGAHVAVTCNSCHSDGVYDGKNTACLSCHTSEWNGTAPSHAGAGFSSSQCATCHNTTAWTGGRYTAHDGSHFRIYSGKHNNRWSSDCSSCHKSTTSYATFTCIACHEHSNKTEVDGHHSGQGGYTYSATSCFGCHSRV